MLTRLVCKFSQRKREEEEEILLFPLLFFPFAAKEAKKDESEKLDNSWDWISQETELIRRQKQDDKNSDIFLSRLMQIRKDFLFSQVPLFPDTSDHCS